ncbi:hypothetical protein G7Y89_g786 [Cudoniella acicularis]|uniref:Cell division control protein 73 C-terminal domain-containing protein n=1 Tax=Cudoniella acicularis TaxID=354080 RepID=A0A8H4W8I7_9HELO|nr:hypothetical protein G7Y89_g786 [Cudoniella acicularis]
MKRCRPILPQRPSAFSSLRHLTSQESDISSYFLVQSRPKTKAGSGDTESTEVSPFGQSNSGHKKGKLRGQSGDSNNDCHHGGTNASETPTETPSQQYRNVTDWNEKRGSDSLQWTFNQGRHPADPPRPPRPGMEWVWFPEGYWAERERKELELFPRKEKSRKRWFNKSSNTSTNTNTNTPTPRRSVSKNLQATPQRLSRASKPPIPQIKIGSISSYKWSSKASESRRNDNQSRDSISAPQSRKSPNERSSILYAGEKEGLYYKARKSIGSRFWKKSKTPSEDSSATPTERPSRTTMLLEGTSNYFEKAEQEEKHRREMQPPQHPKPSPSPDSRPRRGFGLAPWHRKNSSESLLSASTSVYRILMGKTPSATPIGGDKTPSGKGKLCPTNASQQDPLLLLRQSIASESACIPSITEDVTSNSSVDLSLAAARYLQFTSPTRIALPLNTPTRFISSNKPVDLRSIYFAWLKRDTVIPEYNASAQALNTELAADEGAGGEVQNLGFVERLDLITWLEGSSEESEHIKPLASDTVSAAVSAQVASGAAGGIAPVTSRNVGRQNKTIDPRLAEIYNGERRMGDRNSVLRGIKPTDFSHVRKLAHPFNARKAAQAAQANAANNPTLAHNPKAPARRPDPIILLSPSASSLLRMSNIKSFLEGGTYIPPESSSLTSSSSATLLHAMRVLPSIDPAHAMRFIIVDSAEQFKPEYWARVVAVFTTGQAWQFKSYKWQQPAELFRHTLGVYLGWRGDQLPESVKGWGRSVLSTQVEKWSAGASTASRWRDREVVEGIWKAIEDQMRNKGWRRDSGPSVV